MMARKRHGQADDEPRKDANAWMISFADLCTLLLTFFVLLFSMSSLNHRAFRHTFQNFDRSSGILHFKDPDGAASQAAPTSIQEIRKGLESLNNLDVKDVKKIDEDNRAYQRERDLLIDGKAVWLNQMEGNEVFSIIVGQQLLFASGDATLSPKSYPVLETVARFMHDGNYQYYIDGHTDSVPIHNHLYASNDALSLARAQAVMDFFVTHCAVNPKLFALGGYGGSHPLTDNASPAEQGLNRRVEIIFHFQKAR
jgi:chemotaxis protein MotB